MNDYEKYVTEVNMIFKVLEKLKSSWTNSDSLGYIEQINEYKIPVVNAASFLQKQLKNHQKNQEELLS